MTKAKISPNKQYKTRDGREVTNVKYHKDIEKDGGVFCVTASISEFGENETFTKEGQYLSYRESEVDLIEVKQSKKKSTAKQDTKVTNYPTKHIHYDLIVKFAEGYDIEEFVGDNWLLRPNPSWKETSKFRVKPAKIKMLSIVGTDGKSREYPEPIKVALEKGVDIYIPRVGSFEGASLYVSFVWNNDNTDTLWLSRGLIHLTKEAAEQHAKAMLGID